jgi:flagellar biosynthesis chaperone FliJ
MHILEPYWKTHSKLKEMVRKREKEVNDLETKIGKINMEIKNCDRQVSSPM